MPDNRFYNFWRSPELACEISICFLFLPQHAWYPIFMDIVNKRAYFDYHILDTHEAGISLSGSETKAVRSGKMNLEGAFVRISNSRAWLLNATIAPYQGHNSPAEYEPARSRELLLHAREIKELAGVSSRNGLTIMPLRVYTKRHRIKVLIGIGRHKKKADKRELIKKRETEREIVRILRYR